MTWKCVSRFTCSLCMKMCFVGSSMRWSLETDESREK
jgi:hypothetical protein